MRSQIGVGALLALGLGASAAAQQIPFQLLVTQAGSAITVQNGGGVSMVTSVGGSQTAQLKATYTGTGQVTISQQPSVLGSTAFTATIGAALPVLLGPGTSVSITIQFSPTTATLSTAEISLPYLETISATSSNTSTIILGLQGAAPAFTLSYLFQTNQNPLPPGGTVAFGPTLVGTTAQTQIDVTNTGSAPGALTGIAITGAAAFQLQGKPLLPATVGVGQTLPVSVLYLPTAVSTDTGQITFTFDSASPVTINLTGSGNSPSFTYKLLTTPTSTVSPGSTITLASANIGQSSSVMIQVLNSGNANGTVTSISVGGQGFSLSNGPPVLPQTLAPNASLTFTVNFTPTQPGTQTGTLILNSDTFQLSGMGLGSMLTYSYVANGTTIQISTANPSVVFSPEPVTQSEPLIFDVKNTGTLPAALSNIGIANGPYSITGLPPLPVTLAPNGDFQFTITFTPVTVGYSNGSMVLDATTVPLIGSGTQPPPLPSYTITGPSGNAAPMTQPSVGLSLASAYPVAITGTLTMSVGGTLPADPAVQFSTNDRTVSFTIPANQTAAVFGAQGTQLGLQTGTVASNMTLTPTFATQAGNVDLTPTAPRVLQFAVAPATPALTAIQLTGQSANGFTIQLTGFSTTRSLTSMGVQFTTAPGFALATSQFTIDLTQVSTLWFQSTASQAYGGQFTMSIPFTFSVPAGKSVLNEIASISATVSNASGASNSLQAVLQ